MNNLIDCRRAGDGHALIGILFAALVTASVPVSAYAADMDTNAQMALGREVFTKIAVPQCGLCHALEDAGTSGTIGPKLEELKPTVSRVAKAVREGVGVMPSFDGKLTEEQIQAVAQYVTNVVSGSK